MTEQVEIIAGYFPVIHDGYLNVIDEHPHAEIAVLDHDVLSRRFDYLRKDIRALSPTRASELLSGIGRNVRLLGERGLRTVMTNPGLTMPDDDVSRALATEFDVTPHLAPVFLRWDRENSAINQNVEPDQTIMLDSDDPILRALYKEANMSPNWWRRVAAAVAHDGELVMSYHNTSVPTPYSSALDGDPRITAKRGSNIETSIDIHAEARTIAELAKQGISSKGLDMFVTTFPCPNCAKLIAESGIKRCYFIEGYAMVDGQNILKANEIEIIKISTEIPAPDPRTLKDYPAS